MLVRLSKSKYISFIDSDDTWDPKKLEKQIRFMEDNNFDFTYTDYTPFFERDGIKKIKKSTSLVESFNFETFIRNSSINTTTMIISRSILKTHRFKKIKLLEDYVFKCGLLIINVLLVSGFGNTLIESSVSTVKVPKDPDNNLHKSYPVTFFTTVPPDLIVSPFPFIP